METKSRIGRIVAVFLFVAAGSLIAHPVGAIASCWGSNPDGNRTCQEFVSKGGLHLRLCEDQTGDCEQAGYTAADMPAQRPPVKIAPLQHAHGARPFGVESDNYPRDPSAAEAYGGDQMTQGDKNLLEAILIIVGVLIALALFGGTFGRAVAAVVSGGLLGGFGAGETAFWGTMAGISLAGTRSQNRKNRRLLEEREALFARMNEYAMEGMDSATGLSGMAAHKRLKEDRADWERRARKAGWSVD